MSATKRLILGIGHPLRQDDRAGLAVAERLAADPPTGFAIVTHHGEGAGLIELWQEAEQAIVVDAVASGGVPGTLHVIDGAAGPLPSALIAHSSHAFGLAQAIEMARALERLPARFDILGIEGQAFGHGEIMSPAVQDGVGRAEAVIRRELAAPVFDRSRLQAMLGPDSAEIARLIALFRGSAAALVESLLATRTPPSDFEGHAHRLAGAALNAGAGELAGLARRLMETPSTDRKMAAVRLQAAWRRLEAALVEPPGGE
ncbi:MAG: hydrogenase maturation protease [Rhodospirillales bacterium]|nr:hydrogenase maturation protease [Rhodospirillales bacterium]